MTRNTGKRLNILCLVINTNSTGYSTSHCLFSVTAKTADAKTKVMSTG